MIYLYEDIDAVRKYYPNIDDSTFMDLIALDPTYRNNNSLGKYGKWILNLYNKGAISEDDFSEIPSLLNQFTTYRNRVQNKDLNSYKSISDLESILAQVVDDDSMLTDRQKLRFLKKVKSGKTKVDAADDYDVVLETPKFIVYVPNTHEASMFLGKGTDWCTAHENPDWYNNYTENGHKLYIIKDKNTGERWQYSDKNEDFLDENDEQFDIPSLMHKDEKLSKFFKQFLGVDYYNFDGTWIYTGQPIPNDLVEYVENIIIAEGVTDIGMYAFYQCNLTSITIPNSVISIGEGAFCHCSNLENITIPSSIIRIGNEAFYYCSSLKSIVIPNSVISIGKGAFSSCFNLKSITIPDSVTSIGIGAFKNCQRLTVYTDNDYVIQYCDENNIETKPEKEFKNESVRRGIKLKINETDKRGRIYR
jgi:hypothetical protein